MEKIAKDKSMAFAVRIVNLYKYLTETKNEYVVSKQILCSGTSIGANLAESECAISNADFLSKIYIALKECSETIYWLELLNKTDYLSNSQYESLTSNCEELRKILSATTKTLKNKLSATKKTSS